MRQNEHVKSKPRITWIDLARGLAIMLVVLAHCPIPHKLSSYIYSFHVPLFFIISGFLLYDGVRKPWADYIKNKVVRLVVPYLFFSLIGYVYWLITRQTGVDTYAATINLATPMNGTFMAIRNSDFMVHNEALWFICSLFVSEVVFYGIYKLAKGDKALLAMMLLLSAIVGMLYNTYCGVDLPWQLDTVPLVVVFIGLGFFLKEAYAKWLELNLRLWSRLGILGGLMSISVLAWHFNPTAVGTVDMFYSVFGNFVLYFMAALAGSLMVILFFESFLTKLQPLTFLGKNSLIIYALHQKVVFGIMGLVFVRILGRSTPFVGNTSINRLGNGLVYLVAAIIVLLPVISLLNKYCSVFIGGGFMRKAGLQDKLIVVRPSFWRRLAAAFSSVYVGISGRIRSSVLEER